MSCFDDFARSGAQELVSPGDRAIVVPGAIWAVAMFVALAAAAIQPGDPSHRGATPPAEAATVAHGA